MAVQCQLRRHQGSMRWARVLATVAALGWGGWVAMLSAAPTAGALPRQTAPSSGEPTNTTPDESPADKRPENKSAPTSGEPRTGPSGSDTTPDPNPGSGAPSSGDPKADNGGHPPAAPNSTSAPEPPPPAWPGADRQIDDEPLRAAAASTGLLSPALASFGVTEGPDAGVDHVRSAALSVAAVTRATQRKIEAFDLWALGEEQALSRRAALELGALDERHTHHRVVLEHRVRTELARLRAEVESMKRRAHPPTGPVSPQVTREFRLLRDEMGAAESRLAGAVAWARVGHASARVDADQRRQMEDRELRAQIALEQSSVQAEGDQARSSARGELLAQQQVLVESRLSESVPGTGFDLVLLDAFYRAAAAEAECGIRWSVIAAISRIESWHGTYGGGEVDTFGRTTRQIVGPPLDGRGPVALIRDSENGRLDGDAVYDRAVGPMQFIPTSWNIYGADGDEDGISDPNDYHDAARAAAAHLCRSAGGEVNSEETMARAVKGYNRSEDYRANVRLWTTIYDHALVLDQTMLT